MANKTPMQAYKNYSESDKTVLKEIQKTVGDNLGTKVSLADAIAMVEPGIETPPHLTNATY